ncbi:hypothetical protein [Tenacibaculum aestuariivivum]
MYKVIAPEVILDIGIVEFNSKNNKKAYISLTVGITILVISGFVKKK